MSRIEIPNGSFEEDVDSDGVPDRWSVFFYPGGKGNGGGKEDPDPR